MPRITLLTLKREYVLSFVFLLVANITVAAQGLFDGGTPPGSAPGAPAGSYSVSGFENVNLFNGRLNFRLPLLKVGGRGSVGYVVPLRIEPSWQIERSCYGCTFGPQDSPVPGGWNSIDPGFSPGVMLARGVTNDPTASGQGWSCPDQNACFYSTLTRLTFKTSDGTEFELIDQNTRGQQHTYIYHNGDPVPTPFSRGKVFVTHDGSAATFVSDSPISDIFGSSTQYGVTGNLMFRDGTRYRIVNGSVMSIRDRNGNQITFSYNNGSLTQIEDAVGRVVSFGFAGAPCNGVSTCSWISYSGFGGATRFIKFWDAPLDSSFNGRTLLRSDYPLPVKSVYQLFPEAFNPQNVNPGPYNPSKLAAVELPDGRQYRFQYNYFGEVARVDLPTGGAIEYDYAGAGHNGKSIYDWSLDQPPMVYRRVTERRLYANGTTLEGKTTYAVSNSVVLAGVPVGQILVNHRDATNILAHEQHFFHGTPIDNPGPAFWYADWSAGLEHKTEFYKGDTTTLLRRVVKTWRQDPSGSGVQGASQQPGMNPRLVETVTTLADITPNRVTKVTSIDPGDPTGQTVGFDQYNNPTDVWEYDFGQGAPGAFLRRTHTDYITTANYTDAETGAHLRALSSQQWVSSDAAGANKVSLTVYSYDQALLTDRPPSLSGHDPAFTTSYATRGNLTAMTRYANAAAGTGALTTSMVYDIAGNVVSNTDPRGKLTQFGYADSFSSPPAGGVPAPTFAYRTTVTTPVPDVSGVHGSNTALVTTNTYDFSTGLLGSTTEPNGSTTSFLYNDPLERPKQTTHAASGPLSVRSQTTYTYDDGNRKITTTSDLTNFNDNVLKEEVLYDGLGRIIETRGFEDSSNYITRKVEFDAFGRVKRTYNPHRSTNDETYGWTDQTYDALSRPLQVLTFDRLGASTGTVQTDYSGNMTLVTDQAGNKRLSQSNAIGQLKDVWEIKTADPLTSSVSFAGQSLNGYLTHYDYDMLSNLKTVTQGTQPQRTFNYDSLSRLKTANNPESGTSSYDYDQNGNLTQKTDSRGTVTTFEYDNLNRIISRSYSDGTPTVSYNYDTATLGIGLIASVSSSVSSYSYGEYDELGRVKTGTQTTDGQSYTVGYSWNRAGALILKTYPSGRIVKTEFDGAGRIAGIKNEASGLFYAGAVSTDATNRIQYSAGGTVQAMKLGNNLWEHSNFNSRLQTTLIGLGTSVSDTSKLKLEYTYGMLADPTKNNGNVQSQTITVPGLTLTQSYTYDELNRLKSAIEKVGSNEIWKQTFDYDRFGNRTFDALNTTLPVINVPNDPIKNPAISATNNQISTAGYRYDAAGNLECDLLHPCSPNAPFTAYYQFDAENKLKSANGGAGPSGAIYAYDGDGRRVKKVVGGTTVITTIFVYDIMGQMIAEYNDNQQPPTGGTSYLTVDNLGTPRVITKADQSIAGRHDYQPYGEEIPASYGGRSAVPGYPPNDTLRQQFTQYERDSETGLDYAKNRYYASATGRFITVDPALQSINGVNPQSLNRYAYVLGNPLKFIDPLGIWTITYTEIWEEGKYIRTEVTITKSKEDDDAMSLLAQLGYDPKSSDGKKLLAQINEQLKTGEVIDPQKLGGIVGRTFTAFENGITRQVIYERKNGYKQNPKEPGPNEGTNEEYADCSMTACRIALPSQMKWENIKGMGGFDIDKADEWLGKFSAPKDGGRTGDVVRYGKGDKRHFANILFKDDDGVTQIFSRTGKSGRFENLTINDRNLTQDYGTLNKTFRVPFGP